jgi:hypothetical protein
MRLGYRGAPIALVAAGLSIGAAGCGFDDRLTSRGFVEAGDTFCERAIGRSYIELQQAQGQASSGEEVIRTTGAGYATIAAELQNLELRDDDFAMRDAMVRRYKEAATQIDAAADRAARGDAGAWPATIAIIDGLRPFAATLRGYGFRVCGGRDPALQAAR